METGGAAAAVSNELSADGLLERYKISGIAKYLVEVILDADHGICILDKAGSLRQSLLRIMEVLERDQLFILI